MLMDVIEWLGQIGKLDQLIDSKMAERDRVKALAVNTVGSLDGMPHAPGITDKVGNLTVKLIALEEELNALIDEYVDRKQEVVEVLEKLPEREYGVLHRYYIRNMTYEEVGQDMGYSTVQVWRIKKDGIQLLQDMLSKKERG
jgi:RNA polymerase sigma factor (sigma-70 family)